MVTGLIYAAAVLAFIGLVQAKGQSLLGWAVLALAAAMLL